MYRSAILSILILFTGCSSPPEPPVVSGTTRQSINNIETVELISYQKAVEDKIQRIQNHPVILPSGIQSTKPPAKSHIISIYFPFNGTRFKLSPARSRRLRSLLAKACRIDVRGRTDGQRPNPADEKVARNRALAAQRYLIEQGISSAIISVNYLSSGDYIGDNSSVMGRSKNRRVDIEIFN